MPLSPADVTCIVRTLHSSTWDEATVVIGDVSIAVVNRASQQVVVQSVPPPVAPASESSPASLEKAATDTVQVLSPSVGIFRANSSVRQFSEGASIVAGETIAIIEVTSMELPVVSPADAIILTVHCDEGTPVEYGTLLLTLQKKAI